MSKDDQPCPDKPHDAQRFIYLLNAMEAAAQEKNPSEHGYGEKRRDVLRYVADLHGMLESIRELMLSARSAAVPSLKPVAWRYRYGKNGSWRLADTNDDCNPGGNYEIEPLYSAQTVAALAPIVVPSARTSTTEPHVYGRECPAGMVQIEFVGVDPKLKQGECGWRPSKGAFLEVWVDGKRFRIDVGDVQRGDGSTVRGLHVIAELGLKVDKHSINAFDAWHDDRVTNNATDSRTNKE